MYVFWWLAAIFIEFVIMAIIDEFFMMGVIIITFGLLFFSCLFHGDAASKVGLIVSALYALVWGGLICVTPLVLKYTDWNRMFGGYVLMIGFAMMFILLGIYTGPLKVLQCAEKIEATYVGADEYRVKGRTSYTPKFAFEKNGRTYCNATGQSYSKRKIKKFTEGEKYTVYINPQNPNNMCVGRWPSGSSWLLICVGLLCFVGMTQL